MALRTAVNILVRCYCITILDLRIYFIKFNPREMAVLLCLLISLITGFGIHGKNINLEIDSDDIVKAFKGILSSDVVKNFATHLLRRSIGFNDGYINPFHPEDQITAAIDSIVENNNNDYKKTGSSIIKVDSLDKENEQFTDDNISVDIFSENESETRNTKNTSSIDNNNVSPMNTGSVQENIIFIKEKEESPDFTSNTTNLQPLNKDLTQKLEEIQLFKL